MNTIFDYIDWRGDLTFTQSPFNEIDAVIFTQLAYIDFTGIVNSNFSSVHNKKSRRCNIGNPRSVTC